MTRREKLQEACEDAVFALMMDYVAEEEGKKALEENRALREDPMSEVPQEIRRACLNEIHHAFRAKAARSVGRVTKKVVTRVALVALLGMLLFSTAFAISPEFRAKTLNMIINTLDEKITFHNSTPDISEQVGALKDPYPVYVPEGYELTEEGTFANVYWAYYKNEQGDRLEVDISPGGSFDTEGAVLEQTEIYGLPAIVIDQTELEGDKHGIIKVLVLSETDGYVISTVSIPHSTQIPAPINRDEIIKITESIFE